MSSSLEKVLSLAGTGGSGPVGWAEDEGAAFVRAAAKDLDELALLLADSDDDEDDDGEGEDDDEDDSDDPKAKFKKMLAKKKAKGAKGGKVKASALLQEAMTALAHLQGGELLLSRVQLPPVPESDAGTLFRLAGRPPGRGAVAAMAAMEHGPHNGAHSHPHRASHVVDAEHYHNRDSRHSGDAY